MKAEWLIIIIPACMLIVWAVWYNISNKYYNWRYKPENDKCRKGEGPSGPAIAEPGSAADNIPGPMGREQLQIPAPIQVRQNSSSTRGFFAKFRRKS